MIVSPKIMLQDAMEKGYCVPAFNFYNLDVLLAALEAAEEENAPVIVMPYMAYMPFQHYEVFGNAAIEAARQARTSAAVHLDHCTDYQMIMRAIRNNFTSVMADGSSLSIEENIKFSKSVTDVAKSVGIFTEVEMGHIFRVGADENAEDIDETASVEDCVRLVEETGAESLAAAVGTAHGLYTKPPKINFERIKEIAAAVDVPLVLHGGSGTPDEMIKKAIDCGIRKLNVGTELKRAWGDAMREKLNEGEHEPRIISAYAREKVKEVAKQKLRLTGASGKNPGIIERMGRDGFIDNGTI